jgi:hypothetical protein
MIKKNKANKKAEVSLLRLNLANNQLYFWNIETPTVSIAKHLQTKEPQPSITYSNSSTAAQRVCILIRKKSQQ